jgi:hypothetical protein
VRADGTFFGLPCGLEPFLQLGFSGVVLEDEGLVLRVDIFVGILQPGRLRFLRSDRARALVDVAPLQLMLQCIHIWGCS